MLRRPLRSTLTGTLFPYTTLFRSVEILVGVGRAARLGRDNQAVAVERTIAVIVLVVVREGVGRIVLDEQVDQVVHNDGIIVAVVARRSEEHTSELQSLMRISYAVFCLKKKKYKQHNNKYNLTYNEKDNTSNITYIKHNTKHNMST